LVRDFDTQIVRNNAGAEAARITSSGNVGIGTTAPSDTSDVTGSLDVSGAVRTTRNFGECRMVTTDGRGWRMGTTTTGTTLDYFYIQGSTDDFSASFITALAINASGNVLIGTTTEGASKLVVADDSIQINTAKTPASAAATGTTGEFAWDANYFYICTGTNTWRRVAHATW
jgi:hypothetical protein